jgi:hypothetical protein
MGVWEKKTFPFFQCDHCEVEYLFAKGMNFIATFGRIIA